MTPIAKYLNYVREKGKPLAEINPGSDEFALQSEDALDAIEILRTLSLPVLGGDILTTVDEKLIYAYQALGEGLIYLNWYCDRLPTESHTQYCDRSYEEARKAIIKADDVVKKTGNNCHIVLVI